MYGGIYCLILFDDFFWKLFFVEPNRLDCVFGKIYSNLLSALEWGYILSEDSDFIVPLIH